MAARLALLLALALWAAAAAPALGAAQAHGRHRLLLQTTKALPQGSNSNASFAAPAEPGTSAVFDTPAAAEAANPVPAGQWESGGDTGAIYIYATLMKGGEVIGWSNKGDKDNGWTEDGWGTAVYNATSKSVELLPKCGIHDCKNAFCSGQVTTWDNKMLVFGGHGPDFGADITGFRSYDSGTGKITSTQMQSGRWYPTPVTLPDGKVLVIGGVAHNGQAGYFDNVKVNERDTYDNPTITVYDPATGDFSPDSRDMADQLEAAWPVHTYPHAMVSPDGGLWVSAGSSLVKYDRSGPTSFERVLDLPDRPHAPWSYPQTGQGVMLPMFPPYDKIEFLAMGGNVKDRATPETPASDKVHKIELTAGKDAKWEELENMPYPRVLGDAVTLCDGTIGVFGGGERGIAGWSPKPYFYRFKDGTTWDCKKLCTDVHDFLYAPTIFDPATNKFTPKGALAEHMRPRLYHATSILLPDCRVFVGGGDVSNDRTAELYSPPYLFKGPRPVISSVQDSIKPGESLEVSYTSTDPVTKALFLRTGSITHSMSFDHRSLWLTIASNANGKLTLTTPTYMVVILSNKGVPSVGKIVSVQPLGTTSSSSA
ncbi:hypothetical protein COHA_009029 [Chlorella ohadii]|uniref:Galactose oxidase n=1 Tax=Chlorella ohadii TaxID=2649997 RepID=A0AAD5DFM6_9CHLO|nr:hypothetical protein COHA_009029 [Chlorella ohadii]